jgi:hypothetical protein
MNRRESFAATVAHREPERVLVDYGKHIGFFHRLAYGRLRDYAPELDLPEQPVIPDRLVQSLVLREWLCRRPLRQDCLLQSHIPGTCSTRSRQS